MFVVTGVQREDGLIGTGVLNWNAVEYVTVDDDGPCEQLLVHFASGRPARVEMGFEDLQAALEKQTQ